MARSRVPSPVVISYPLKSWLGSPPSVRFLMMRLAEQHWCGRKRMWLYFQEDCYAQVLDILERRAFPFSTNPSLN